MKKVRETALFLLLAWCILLLLAAVTYALYVPLANHAAHVACLRLGENTDLATRYVGFAPYGDCYVYDHTAWIPASNWRVAGGR